MGQFLIGKNQQAVQGIPIGRINDLQRRIELLEAGGGNVVIPTGASDPATAEEGQLFINTTDNGYKVYYGGTWQTLHTLTSATLLYWLQEDGTSGWLLEDGSSRFALQ